MLHALTSPRKGVIYGHSKKYFMNIYGSLMDIFDEKYVDIVLLHE